MESKGQTHQRPRIVLGGTSSGAGKTTLSIGLMAALRKRGLHVQGFKVGPDYIDPTYHTAATGRISRNLDTWMMPPQVMHEVFLRGSQSADISLIEGVMGFYDGKDPLSNQGSTAEISLLLQAPVILVLDVKAMARSAAAIVKGFQALEPAVKIAGVIANRCGSANHFKLVKAAVEQMCNVPVIGYLPNDPSLQVPERHLGLIPAIERGEMEPWFDLLAEKIEATVDLELLLSLANGASALAEPTEKLLVGPSTASSDLSPVKLAVAKDEAFNFYYQENLELLEAYGAQLSYFSPLHGELPPKDADGLYIGGGFPEEFAERLSQWTKERQTLHGMIEEGLPTFAECGGFMYLCQSITDRAGQQHEMVGVIPYKVEMQQKLAALGYREALAERDSLLLLEGETARGHEFHYSKITEEPTDNHAYQVKGMRGVKKEGYAKGNLLAGYTHLHFASQPGMIKRWLDSCREYATRKSTVHKTSN
ncbi:cobyrinate a,c-diamide synthase [Brevibacillus laterosporus]|uniref:cobyrinate a,c-diamide synthase n=1 Tax=Brevibacillus laterosporus TaxID=1465 RepID=UPI0018CD2040|nr:cobyrinate a,c-diamide synthase [Brevibacillus laterosporus]MBG9796294.1 cobyrinic acid a,c-diamide synthase [Brevibacillus laterosporus]MCR8937296.1 cobyrinate a,c-diamide synthase [Brevibacillus laterosporus]MCZ0839935.1 cobyrinate a,c-diamide synthase [Brevibacillus laterosporus]MCZ0843495.1 cobyrinate a,c-diamide synthase [Brevibacillus laterosporus]MED1910145.1 cobyrinate a,c-diamide synthase [Brevibacillus laterosporus]